jgi:hypothetical protein
VSASEGADGPLRTENLRAVEADVEAEIGLTDSSRPPGPVRQVDAALSVNPAELDQYKVRLHTLLDATHVVESLSAPDLSHRPGASGPTR